MSDTPQAHPTIRTVRTPPRALPALVPIAVLVALLMIALPVVAVRDLAVQQDWTRGDSWSRSLVDSLDGLTSSTAIVAAGVAVAVVGLLIVIAALGPGRKTHLRTNAQADLWLSPRALGALAAFTADRSPGVISAEATRSGRRRVVVEVVTQDDQGSVISAVQDAVAAGPGQLTSTNVTVRTKQVPR